MSRVLFGSFSVTVRYLALRNPLISVCRWQVVLWFRQTFPFAASYAASWEAAQLDGEALLMMDDEGLRDDIPIGVRAHRGIILKKIDALRAAADTAATAPSMLMNSGTASAAVARSTATGGVSEALAVAKRELAAAQEENAALREALAGDRFSASPLLLGNSNTTSSDAVTVPSLSNSGVAVRLSIRKPTGDYIKLEVGEQTLIAELKAELSNLTGMPLRTQVCTRPCLLLLPTCSNAPHISN